jgi:HAD superfamily hydrolase (TIGR01509 family)
MSSPQAQRARQLQGVFLDFEGTLNDTRGTGRLYAGSFIARMSREYSVAPEAWGGALAHAMSEIQRLQAEAAAAADQWRGYTEYRSRELTTWLQVLMRRAGLEPPDDDQALALARRLEEEIPLQMAPIPGALEVISALSDEGWPLFISSGAPSGYTRRCLEAAGVAGRFKQVYGPDVVDTLKLAPEYFTRAFTNAGLKPRECIVVDDSEGPLAWAMEAGAGAVVAVGEAALGQAPAQAVKVRNLGDLPRVLRLLKR